MLAGVETAQPDFQELWSLLFKIVIDIEKRLAAHMAAFGLTPPQFYVLKTLVEHDGQCAIGEIARAHHLTNATMTGLVKRLEGMRPALVGRERSHDDRRSVVVRLTDEGMARFLAVQHSLLSQVFAMLSVLDEKGQRELMDYANRYVTEVTQRFPVSDIGQG